ncbi:MAG: site-specific integrase [Cyanobacteriota bacterium]|nr:site-specific integrase [Cyanobacteriota bacterium]
MSIGGRISCCGWSLKASSAVEGTSGSTRSPGLIQPYREELQVRHYVRRTVKSYEHWLRRFPRFHQLRHPREIGSEEVNTFLSHLAVKGLYRSLSQEGNPSLSTILKVLAAVGLKLSVSVATRDDYQAPRGDRPP